MRFLYAIYFVFMSALLPSFASENLSTDSEDEERQLEAKGAVAGKFMTGYLRTMIETDWAFTQIWFPKKKFALHNPQTMELRFFRTDNKLYEKKSLESIMTQHLSNVFLLAPPSMTFSEVNTWQNWFLVDAPKILLGGFHYISKLHDRHEKLSRPSSSLSDIEKEEYSFLQKHLPCVLMHQGNWQKKLIEAYQKESDAFYGFIGDITTYLAETGQYQIINLSAIIPSTYADGPEKLTDLEESTPLYKQTYAQYVVEVLALLDTLDNACVDLLSLQKTMMGSKCLEQLKPIRAAHDATVRTMRHAYSHPYIFKKIINNRPKGSSQQSRYAHWIQNSQDHLLGKAHISWEMSQTKDPLADTSAIGGIHNLNNLIDDQKISQDQYKDILSIFYHCKEANHLSIFMQSALYKEKLGQTLQKQIDVFQKQLIQIVLHTLDHTETNIDPNLAAILQKPCQGFHGRYEQLTYAEFLKLYPHILTHGLFQELVDDMISCDSLCERGTAELPVVELCLSRSWNMFETVMKGLYVEWSFDAFPADHPTLQNVLGREDDLKAFLVSLLRAYSQNYDWKVPDPVLNHNLLQYIELRNYNTHKFLANTKAQIKLLAQSFFQDKDTELIKVLSQIIEDTSLKASSPSDGQVPVTLPAPTQNVNNTAVRVRQEDPNMAILMALLQNPTSINWGAVLSSSTEPKKGSLKSLADKKSKKEKKGQTKNPASQNVMNQGQKPKKDVLVVQPKPANIPVINVAPEKGAQKSIAPKPLNKRASEIDPRKVPQDAFFEDPNPALSITAESKQAAADIIKKEEARILAKIKKYEVKQALSVDLFETNNNNNNNNNNMASAPDQEAPQKVIYVSSATRKKFQKLMGLRDVTDTTFTKGLAWTLFDVDKLVRSLTRTVRYENETAKQTKLQDKKTSIKDKKSKKGRRNNTTIQIGGTVVGTHAPHGWHGNKVDVKFLVALKDALIVAGYTLDTVQVLKGYESASEGEWSQSDGEF